MKKALYILVILVALDWLFDAHLRVLSTARDVFRDVNMDIDTRHEMQQIARVVRRYHQRNGELPLHSLQEVIANHERQTGRQISSDAGRDMWGSSYRVTTWRNGFAISSAGPDQKWHTDDDLQLDFRL